MKMTPKQRLQNLRNNLLMELYELTGESNYKFRVSVSQRELDMTRVFEFENEINRLQKTKEDLLLFKKKEEFFQTNDGKAYKEFHEMLLKGCEENYSKELERRKAVLDSKIKVAVGPSWKLRFSNPRLDYFSIQKVNGLGQNIFGTEVEFRYELGYDNELRVNFGTTGSFLVTGSPDPDSRKSFYIEVGNMLQNTDFLTYIKGLMHLQQNHFKSFDSERKEIVKKLENPFDDEN